MSLFQTTLKTEQLGRRTNKLLGELVLSDDAYGEITVPAGFVTDFASIKVLHNAFLFVLFALVSGYGNPSATVHDWLYRRGTLTRSQADEVLYRALRAEGIAKWRCWMFWAGVRIGGGTSYLAGQAFKEQL